MWLVGWVIGSSSRFTLFMDIDDIPLGVDFTTALNEAVNSSDVLVVLIGQRFFGTDPVLEPRPVSLETGSWPRSAPPSTVGSS